MMSDYADAIERAVHHPAFLPHRGWQSAGNNDPVIQQDRGEFLEFAALLQDYPRKKCLQLGLGVYGAAHLAWQELFEQVWTIDISEDQIAAFQERFPDAQYIIKGDLRDRETKKIAALNAPYDLIFIDAEHFYDDVKADWEDYSPFVKKGGIVAFHDALIFELPKFLAELRQKVDLQVIGSMMGIAWYVKDA